MIRILCTDYYHRKNGNQHNINVPIIIPNVLAALCSRFILIIFRSLVGVQCMDEPTSLYIFDDDLPLLLRILPLEL